MRKINSVIQDNFFHERLNQFDQLTQLICNVMSLSVENHKNHVWPVVRSRRLILMTDDPHLATQARFMLKPLCQHINEQTQLKISGVDIKLVSIPLPGKRDRLSRQKISAATAQVLNSIAESIEDHDLQAVLQRLAAIPEKNRKF